jgi:hypothetical protein
VKIRIAAATVIAAGSALIAPQAVAAPTPRPYLNCTALNKVYPHGVGMPGAVDKTTGTRVRNFYVSSRAYRLNDGRVYPTQYQPSQYDLDRDNDQIACEKR